jgi:hypothetical protein
MAPRGKIHFKLVTAASQSGPRLLGPKVCTTFLGLVAHRVLPRGNIHSKLVTFRAV